MTSFICAWLFALLLSSSITAHAGETDLILEMEQRYSDAIRGDYDALEELLAADFFYNTAEGSSVARDPFIALLKAGSVQLGDFRREQVEVQFHGDVALVSAVTRVQARVDGVDRDIASRHLHVWVRSQERWRLAARQVTYMR
jgi:ketosteroid isomerase-like protein